MMAGKYPDWRACWGQVLNEAYAKLLIRCNRGTLLLSCGSGHFEPDIMPVIVFVVWQMVFRAGVWGRVFGIHMELRQSESQFSLPCSTSPRVGKCICQT
jgi:hypothetical protein